MAVGQQTNIIMNESMNKSEVPKLWAMIPRSIRRPLFSVATSILAARAVKQRIPKAGPATVVGLLRSTQGIGQAARLTLAALREIGLETRSVDLCRFFRWDEHLVTDLGQVAQPGEGGTLIIQVNPPEFPFALSVLGRELLRDKRIIGYWAWELPGIPPSWRRAFGFVDEIWVPSRFIANAVRQHTDTPMRVVPYPVRCPIFSPKGRLSFGIPEHGFVCLTVLDARSGIIRKNPLGAIQAFRMAFGDSQEAALILKITEGVQAPSMMRRLEHEANHAPNIRFIFEKLSIEEMGALMQCADVVLSLHRSEGFGLVLAEAMLSGKPVVATGWSGNTEFMNPNNSILIDYQLIPVRDAQGIYAQTANQVWAEPNLEQAAEWLKKLACSEALRMQLGQAAAREAQQFFSLNAFKEAIGDLAGA